MGYTRRTLRLTFADPEMAGLEIVARPLSVRDTLALMNMQAGATTEGIDAMLTLLGSVMISWNLEEEDGTPVPCTAEMLNREGMRFATTVLTGYLEAVTSVPPPLAGTSAAGVPPQELSLPMEVASPNLGS